MTKDPSQRTLFGHPVGLFILFFTEMWERFSYYGMRAILTLYMYTSVADNNPGLGWDEAFALSIYGWYTMLVYVMSIPGGILADKFIGQKRAVFIGGLILVAGHSVLAIDMEWAFFTGLGLIVLGVGCLKPNISTMVGGLYKQGDIRRDSGFTIFYIGINVGAFLASVIVGLVAHAYGWHWGFGLAGIGMTIGQIGFMWGQKFLKGVGEPPAKSGTETDESLLQVGDEKNSSLGDLFSGLGKSPKHLIITLIVAALGCFLAFNYTEGGDSYAWSALSVFIALVIGVLMMVYKEINKIEKDRFIVLLISFLIVIVFWGAFEQAGGLMNIYTDVKIDRVVPLFSLDILFFGGAALLLLFGIRAWQKKQDSRFIYLPIAGILLLVYFLLRTYSLTDPYEIPTAVFQSVNALFIIIFGTVVGGFWIWWQRKGREASSLLKMAVGTIIMGVGFLFMAKASIDIQMYGDKAALMLLILAYFFHTIGELCASPVALSFITKLAPVKYVSLMMGVYFAATGFGNKVAGTIGELTQAEPVKTELVANAGQLTPYLEGQPIDSVSTFNIVGKITLENGSPVITDGETNLNSFINLDEENKDILVNSLETFENESGDALTAVLSFEKEDGAFKGQVKVFEIQDNLELRTFIGIFIFTSAFGILLLLFFRKLKKLTHGAEEMKDTHDKEQEGYEIADPE